MEHWEFLLRKAGDHACLPLEPPNAEILEGQYQVLARSSLIDQTINIQISHWFDRNGVPEQQLQEFSQTTNSEGVVVVVPFAYFQPGLWQLSCTLSQVVDSAEGAWGHSIQLQVLHQDVEASDDWDVTWQAQPDNQASLPDQKNKVPTSQGQIPIQHVSERAPLRLPNFTRQSSLQSSKTSEGQVSPPKAQSPASNVGRKSLELPAIPSSKVSPVELEIVRSYLEKVHSQKPTSHPDPQSLPAETAFEALNLRERFRSTLSTLARKAEPATPPTSDRPQDLVDPTVVEPDKTEPVTPPTFDPPQDFANAAAEPDTAEPVTSPTFDPPQDLSNTPPVELDAAQNTAQTNPSTNLDPSQEGPHQASAAITETLNPNESSTQSQESIALPVTTTEQPSPVETQWPASATEPIKSTSEVEALPVPGLVLPEEELVMGQVIPVRVTLPSSSVPVYVKLWINDRQTRSLLDGPRWLIEFTLNQRLGVLEASTQLMVPLGLEISFEAIAVDMQTQRESYKATVNRPVMPLGLFLVEDSDANAKS